MKLDVSKMKVVTDPGFAAIGTSAIGTFADVKMWCSGAVQLGGTYTKTKTGGRAVRCAYITSSAQDVLCTKRNGEQKIEQIGRLIWTDKTVAIYAIRWF